MLFFDRAPAVKPTSAGSARPRSHTNQQRRRGGSRGDSPRPLDRVVSEEGSREGEVQTVLVVFHGVVSKTITVKEQKQMLQRESWKVTSRRQTLNKGQYDCHSRVSSQCIHATFRPLKVPHEQNWPEAGEFLSPRHRVRHFNQTLHQKFQGNRKKCSKMRLPYNHLKKKKPYTLA